MQVDIYSDVVCPWCYIGERRFVRAIGASGLAVDADVRVTFKPFQLDPDAPAPAEPLSQYLARRFGRPVDGMLEAVTQAGAGEGLAFAWDRALAGNTRTAHRLLAFAQREGGPAVQRALLERLFALHFSEGGDITGVDPLTDAAAAVGLDGDRVRAFLASSDGLAELDAAFDQARRIGIRAVPTFVFDGRHGLQGAQPLDVFVQTLREFAGIDRTPGSAS